MNMQLNSGPDTVDMERLHGLSDLALDGILQDLRRRRDAGPRAVRGDILERPLNIQALKSRRLGLALLQNSLQLRDKD